MSPRRMKLPDDALEPVRGPALPGMKVRGVRCKRPLPPRYSRIMSDAPRDGRGVVLMGPDGTTQVEACWRESRQMNFRTARFEPVGFWAVRGSRIKIGFKPIAWRPAWEFRELAIQEASVK